MKATKLRDMSPEELGNEVMSLRRALFNLRVQAATGQLEKPHKLKQTKRDLARALTILGEHEAAEQEARS